MKKINLISLLVSTFIIYSCQIRNEENLQKEKPIKFFPLVLDTINIEKFNYRADDEATWLTTADYGLYYIGVKKDTLYANPFIGPVPPPPPPPPPGTNNQDNFDYLSIKAPFEKYYIDWTEEKEYKYWEETEYQIQVDTLKKINDSYPVLITNIDKDTSTIGYGNHIPLIMEALDSTGKWKPIQERYVHMCGVGLSSVFLPPNECVLTLAPIFKGNFRTELRLKIGNSYSEAFNGFINYRQFESRYNDYGNHKEEYKKELEEKK